MSYLKDLMKDGANLSLEFFIHSGSENNKKVVLNPNNKDSYLDYERKSMPLTISGINKTSRYYNIESLKEKIKSLNKNINEKHKGYDFLSRIQNIDFVPADYPGYKRNYKYNIFINRDNVEEISTIDISNINLLSEEGYILYPVSICKMVAGRSGASYTIYSDSIGNLFCIDTFGVKCKMNINSIYDLIKVIGKSEGNNEYKDYFVINKNLVAKLKQNEDY